MSCTCNQAELRSCIGEGLKQFERQLERKLDKKPLILCDAENKVFWLVSEYSGNIDDDPFQKYLDTQINRLNIATVANLAIPDGTKTPSGWKLKWSVKNSPEWTSRPVLPIRDFVRRGMTNSKLYIPELIKILDEFRSGKRA